MLASSPAAGGVAAGLGPGEGVLGSITLAQAVETDSVQSMSVEDVVASAKKWDLAIYGVAAVLVLAFLLAAGLLSPGGIEKAGLRDIKGLPWIVWLFAGLVVYLSMASAAVVLDQTEWWRNEENLFDDERFVVLQGVAVLFGIVAGVGMLYILGKSVPEGGLKLGFLDITVGLGCFALMLPIVMLAGEAGVALHTQFAGEPPPEIAHETLDRIVSWYEGKPGDPWLWGLFAIVVIGFPFVEELIYRVFLQSAAIRLVKSPWVGIVITSLIFALMHKGVAPWHALVPLFALAVCCGLAYERTKRVGVPITMHACFNALNIAVALLSAPEVAQPTV